MKQHAMTAPTGGIPRLCSGDRLSRDEFERRYAAAGDMAAVLQQLGKGVADPAHAAFAARLQA
jgi:hypothetical protein